MKEQKREFVVDPQTDFALREWAKTESRSIRNLLAIIVRRQVQEWRESRERQQRPQGQEAR
jgi:hypothetical protein